MDVKELQARAVEIQQLYFRLNERTNGRRWTTEETMLGFVGDVGDLANWSWLRKACGPYPAVARRWPTSLRTAYGLAWSSPTPTRSTCRSHFSRPCTTWSR